MKYTQFLPLGSGNSPAETTIKQLVPKEENIVFQIFFTGEFASLQIKPERWLISSRHHLAPCVPLNNSPCTDSTEDLFLSRYSAVSVWTWSDPAESNSGGSNPGARLEALPNPALRGMVSAARQNLPLGMFSVSWKEPWQLQGWEFAFFLEKSHGSTLQGNNLEEEGEKSGIEAKEASQCCE